MRRSYADNVDCEVPASRASSVCVRSLLAEVAPHEAALSFVTVGELTRWIYSRDLGPRRRQEIEALLSTRPMLPGGRDVATKWGEIIAYADRRGRLDDFVEYEGLGLITR